MLTDTHISLEPSDAIQEVIRYIREHLHEPLDRETLAAVAGFSVPHFHRVFSAHTGESAIGYESHAAFTKAFKQQYGVRPSEFRQLACQAATQLFKKG